jgi:hypothetical protein
LKNADQKKLSQKTNKNRKFQTRPVCNLLVHSHKWIGPDEQQGVFAERLVSHFPLRPTLGRGRKAFKAFGKSDQKMVVFKKGKVPKPTSIFYANQKEG